MHQAMFLDMPQKTNDSVVLELHFWWGRELISRCTCVVFLFLTDHLSRHVSQSYFWKVQGSGLSATKGEGLH